MHKSSTKHEQADSNRTLKGSYTMLKWDLSQRDIYMYIYLSQRDIYIYTHIYISIYISIYICVYIYISIKVIYYIHKLKKNVIIQIDTEKTFDKI